MTRSIASHGSCNSNCITTSNILKKAFVYSELQKMRRYERLKLLHFDQLVITDSSDRDQLTQLTGQAQNIRIVSNQYFVDKGQEEL